MAKRRSSTGRQPAAKRTKQAPKHIDTQAGSTEAGPSSAPLDLQQYIGTFDDIDDYQQARRWCKYFGRKGRNGNLHTLKGWLKDHYDRKGKGPLNKPNDLPPGFSPTGEQSPDPISEGQGATSPGSRRSSPRQKTLESSRPSSRGAMTPEHELLIDTDVEAVAKEDPNATDRIVDAWRLLRTATNMLERERRWPGVEDALRRLDAVLYESLAGYESSRVSDSPAGYQAATSAERRRKLTTEEDQAVEDNAAHRKKQYGRQSWAAVEEQAIKANAAY